MNDKEEHNHNHLPFTEAEERVFHALEEKRNKVNQKFPLWTAMAATFGLVAVLYGAEKIIDRIPFLVNNPWILIMVGILVLVATGSTYKKL